MAYFALWRRASAPDGGCDGRLLALRRPTGPRKKRTYDLSKMWHSKYSTHAHAGHETYPLARSLPAVKEKSRKHAHRRNIGPTATRSKLSHTMDMEDSTMRPPPHAVGSSSATQVHTTQQHHTMHSPRPLCFCFVSSAGFGVRLGDRQGICQAGATADDGNLSARAIVAFHAFPKRVYADSSCIEV